MKVSVRGANIRFTRGTFDAVETEYYGSASERNYKLAVKEDGNAYKI